MVFILVLIVITLIIFVGFYILSFSFLGWEFSNFYWNIFQSQVIVSQNFKLVDDYKNYFLINWSWYNDLTGNIIDDNHNDDNHFCRKNIWTWYKDDDCLYRSLYWFIPPNKQIDLWYFENISGSWLNIYFSWNINEDIIVSLNYLNKWKRNLYNFQKSGYIESEFKKDNINLKLKNKNNSRIQYFISLKNGEWFKELNINKSNYKREVSYNYNYFLNDKKLMYNDLLLSTGYNQKPINPFSWNLKIWDFDIWWSNCSTTWINDISFSWKRIWNKNLTWNIYFEILSWTNKNLTGNSLKWLSLSSYCDGNFLCTWTWKNYNNDTYYFKVNTYRCIDDWCNLITENINWSYIYSWIINTCWS